MACININTRNTNISVVVKESVVKTETIGVNNCSFHLLFAFFLSPKCYRKHENTSICKVLCRHHPTNEIADKESNL